MNTQVHDWICSKTAVSASAIKSGHHNDQGAEQTVEQDVVGLTAEFAWEHDAAGNVKQQSERWPWVPERAESGREKTTVMTYDEVYRLLTETVTGTGQNTEETAYTYDDANNRSTRNRSTGGAPTEATSYIYNGLNQLTSWETLNGAGALLKSAILTYDPAGNRSMESVTEGAVVSLKSYTWDAHNRLKRVIMPNGGYYTNSYDYRTRRREERWKALPTSPLSIRKVIYSGGLATQEYLTESTTVINPAAPTVEYQRGDGMGGGVGGMLYSMRSGQAKFSLSNGRGDVVAQSDSQGAVTWTASYEAFGKRTKETGTNLDRQRANTKEEDPTGLLNEGFRYRDLETGVWLSRDPAGFVDGPNLYAYVRCNPWSKFDPKGLEGVVVSGQPGDHSNRTHFLANGLDRAKKMTKEYKDQKKIEKVTWMIYNDGGRIDPSGLTPQMGHS